MLQVHLAVLALAALALAVSGCGSSSKSATTTSEAATTTTSTTSAPTTTTVAVVKLASGKPLTHAEWLAKGDAICARLNAQLAGSGVKSIRELGQVLPEAAAYERAELAQLVKIVPPASEAKSWQKFLTETQQWAENSTKLGQSAQTTQFSLTEPLVALTRKLHENLARRAKRDGFKECSLI